MKPSASRTTAAIAAIALLAAQTSAFAATVGAGEGQVDIVAWPGYIERGETDKAYDWVTSFEKDTGCKVNVKTAATSDEMVTLMNQGGFDLVTASGDASLRLVAGKKVQAIDPEKVPSWKSVDERLINAPWHTVDGKHYGVPFQWGPNVLLYNTDVFKEAPKSWSVVFEPMEFPDGKPNKGRVQAYDGPIYVADAANYLSHKKPQLGIKDPYALTEEQYAAALELLKGQRALVAKYWHDAAVQVDDFKTEGVVASSSWPFQVNTLIADSFKAASTTSAGGSTPKEAPAPAKPKYASTIPEEGATGWADTTMLATGAKHPNCAYKWLEHSISPKTQGDLAAWFGSVPSVPAACKDNELLGAEGCATNGFDKFEKIKFWRTPTAKCGEGTCVPYSRWVSDYIAVMGK